MKKTEKDPTKPLGRKPYPRDESGKIIHPENKINSANELINFFCPNLLFFFK